MKPSAASACDSRRCACAEVRLSSQLGLLVSREGTPTARNPRIIGQAENALRAVLSRAVARTGGGYQHWVALHLAATNGGTIKRDQLIGRLTGALKVDDAAVRAVIAELTAT